jgi:N6-L-threonylcarbamoyladenine synthase
MKILSIETSCDDTSICIMEAKGSSQNASFKILASSSNSQIKIHIPYGGVFPALAKREHLRNLPILLDACLKQANLTPAPLINKERGLRRGEFDKPSVDLITVTSGPGLEIALWTGIVFAKELAEKWKIPLMPVNHMEGHLFSVFGKAKGKFEISKTKNPTLALLVSGGHTELVLIKKPMDYKTIGQTLDDAVGEAFDKVARMLGLPYPGGPEISKIAEKGRDRENQSFWGHNFSAEKFIQSSGRRPAESPQRLFSLPRPMLYSKNFDFSFSGLKTAVLYLIRDLGGRENIDKKTKALIALEFENAAIECLVYKTKKALQEHKIKTLIVAGGVSANKYLRSEMVKLAKKEKIKLLFPSQELTGDNSIMIGIAGYLRYIKNKKKVPKLGKIKATGNLGLKYDII